MHDLDDFKKWIADDFSLKRPNLVGKHVLPQFNKKLSCQITVENGDLPSLIKDFKNNGGKVVKVEGKSLIIEVDSGSFSIHKSLVM